MAKPVLPHVLEDVKCPAYETCEKVTRTFSLEIPACMAIRISEDMCLNCTEKKTTSTPNPKT